jgi:hypothetical protein
MHTDDARRLVNAVKRLPFAACYVEKVEAELNDLPSGQIFVLADTERATPPAVELYVDPAQPGRLRASLPPSPPGRAIAHIRRP